jgi:cell division septation protein DedD
MAALHYPLEQHIFHLLFQEDSVDVPGFGRLEAQRFGAEIQLQSGLFLPPARRLSFTPVAGPSQVLINHLGRFEGLTSSQAQTAIAATVNTWNRQLLEGKRLRLDGIGSFSKTGLQWVFQAAIESNFLPEAYGLPIFRVTPLAQRHQPTQEGGYTLPLPQVQRRREQWLAPLRAAAVVTGAVSLLALGTTKSDFRDFVQNASFRPQWEEWVDNVQTWFEPNAEEVAVADTFGQQSVPALTFEDAAVEAPEVLVAELPKEVSTDAKSNAKPESAAPKAAKPSEGSYALVVGAFSDENNAHRLVKTLTDAGYPAKVLEAKVGLTKVALRTFANREAAQAAKEEAKAAFPAVWIYSE